MPRCQDIKISLRARGQILPLVGFPSFARGIQNPSFLHPATTMAAYQHNPLFTIQKLLIPGAAATKISIFWYPESRIKPPWAPIEQPSGTQAGRYSRHASQAAHQRGPKVSKSFVHEAHRYHWFVSPGLTRYPKIDHFCTILPECRNMRKPHYLLHFSHAFGVPGPPKYRYFGTLNRA